MKRVKLLYILLVSLLLPMAVYAQSEEESVRVYFRQGSSTLERDYLENDAALEALAERLGECGFDENRGKGRVRISSSVSPEGSTSINDRLIKARAKSISDWVSRYFDVEVGYIVDSMGVDWVALEDLVEASENVPYKEEVLDVLRNTPETVTSKGKVVNSRQNALVKLRGGVPYKYIYRYIYPKLRYAAAYTEIWYAPLIEVTSPKLLSYNAEGGQGAIAYTKEEGDKAEPQVSCDAEWITNIVHDGCDVTFQVEANSVAKPRKAIIILDHYENLHEVVVEQEGAEPGLFFSNEGPVEIDAIGGRNAIDFTTNKGEAVVPRATSKAAWISNIKTTSSRISFTAAPNMISEPRSAVITVEVFGKNYDVVVNQAAAAPREVVVSSTGNAVENPQLVLDRTETVRIYFRQGSSKLEPGYMNNSAALKELAELLEPYVIAEADEKGKVRISSSVSPEGSIGINDRLVKARARAISNWISQRFNVEVGFIVDSMGVDWETLITLIEEDDNVPYREEVLDLLFNTPERVTRNGKVINEREAQLKRLRKGVPYRYIYTNIYPKLRYAAAYTEIWYASEMTITVESPLKFGAEGGSGVITYAKNVNDKVVPKTTCRAEWISGIVADLNDIDFTVAANDTADERMSKIYVECYGQMHEIVVEQEAGEPVWSISYEGDNRFGAEGGQGTIAYKTNTVKEVTPEASCQEEWIKDIVVSDKDITYTVLPNAVAESRKGTILLTCFGQQHEVVVEQEADEAVWSISCEGDNRFGAEGGQGTIAYTTNSVTKVAPEASCQEEWIKDIVVSDKDITYTVLPNTVAESRKGTILLTCFGQQHEVVVEQEAAILELTFETPSPRNFPAEGGVDDVRFQNNSPVKVVPTVGTQATWISDLVASKENLTYSVARNPWTEPRSAVITVECYGQVHEVVVNQEASKPTWNITYAGDNHFGAEGGTGNISFMTNTTKEVIPTGESQAEWIENIAPTATNITYKVAPNTIAEPRKDTLVLTCFDQVYKIVVEQDAAAPEFTFETPSPRNFPAEGGADTVVFRTNSPEKMVPSVSTQAEWVKDLASTDEHITYNVDTNRVIEPRSTVIAVEGYGKVQEVVVNQEGAEPAWSLQAGETLFGAEGGQGTLTYQYNSTQQDRPVAESRAEWIENLVVGEKDITYTVQPNPVAEPRQDTITVTCFDQPVKVIVQQEAAEAELTFVTPTPRNFAAEGGVDTLVFKTNSPEKVVPSVSTEATWLKELTPTEEFISYKVARNRVREPRTATISVGCFDKYQDVVVNQEAKPECETPWYASVKTNALYDLLLIPNIGAEFYLGHNLSVAGNWHYAWWKSDAIKWYWRTYGGDLSLRYWFGKAANEKPLTGHHIGPYGQIITYDFELGKKGILADRWSWSAGLEYGYSWPLTRQLNLDCTVGVGYHTGTFYEYLPIDTHYVWQATKKRNYIGPTKAEVSLVWLFGCKNYNQMKGE